MELSVIVSPVLQIELPPHDLSQPAALTQTLQLLTDVLACHDASVVPIDDKKHDFKQVTLFILYPKYDEVNHK